MSETAVLLERMIPSSDSAPQALCMELRNQLQAQVLGTTTNTLIFAVEIVAREAIQNIIDHGYRRDPTGLVRISATIEGKLLRLVIAGDGEGFDTQAAFARLEETDPGCSGNGLRIIAAYTDSFEYQNQGRTLVAYFQLGKEMLMQDTTSTGCWAPQSDIVADNCQEAKETLRALVASSSGEFVVDLNGVGMIDSKGLGILIATVNSLEAAGRTLRVTGANGDLVELFRMMRLDKHMVIG